MSTINTEFAALDRDRKTIERLMFVRLIAFAIASVCAALWLLA